MSFLADLFLPHHKNNHKAHLIKSYSLFFLSFVFISLQIFLNFFLLAKPAVLGFSSNITPERIIELTNAERAKRGLGLLQENKLLSEAARQKAADMFTFNYWSHVSPSGKTPWTFFTDVGYKYQYAGENLARDFRDPESVVAAWMNSPTHRENIVNNRYQEIGVAVVDGTLQGAETTLVVQLFGTPYGALSSKSSSEDKIVIEEEQKVVGQEVLAEKPEIQQSPFFAKRAFSASPLDLTKVVAIFIAGVLIVVFAIDFLLVSHHHTPRLTSRSLAQMLFLIFVLVASLLIEQGAIL